jgi:hypothetical protein
MEANAFGAILFNLLALLMLRWVVVKTPELLGNQFG